MIEFISNNLKEIISTVAPFLLWWIARQFTPKAKLVHSTRHAFTFVIREPVRDKDGKELQSSQAVQTASISVTNIGREAAKSVEIVFNWRPHYFNVWPPRAYDTKLSEDGRFSILLANMAPKEVFGIELLSVNGVLPALTNVRSEQCESVQLAMIPQAVQPRWKVVTAVVLMFAGLIGMIYGAMSAAEAIIVDVASEGPALSSTNEEL